MEHNGSILASNHSEGSIFLPPTLLSITDRVFFEGMKATKCHGEPTLFRPEMHARRFNLSAERMCMPQIPEDLFMQALEMLVDFDSAWIPEGEDHALYIRPLMFATDEYFGVHASEKYTFLIFAGPVGPYYPKPVKLWVEEVFTRAVQGGPGEAKCAGNYGSSLLPAMRAKRAGYDQVMWMDAVEKKFVQEVGTMNLFSRARWQGNHASHHRHHSSRCYPRLHHHAAARVGYTVEDRLLGMAEITDAYWRGTLQECFGAGTAAVVSHVSEITWRDKHSNLPPVDEQHRPISTRLRSTLTCFVWVWQKIHTDGCTGRKFRCGKTALCRDYWIEYPD
jgi:branched-chain amino acid aminotransferase